MEKLGGREIYILGAAAWRCTGLVRIAATGLSLTSKQTFDHVRLMRFVGYSLDAWWSDSFENILHPILLTRVSCSIWLCFLYWLKGCKSNDPLYLLTSSTGYLRFGHHSPSLFLQYAKFHLLHNKCSKEPCFSVLLLFHWQESLGRERGRDSHTTTYLSSS